MSVLTASAVIAHGIGGVQDLPVPQWLFYWGAALVLALSFALLGGLWRRPMLEGAAAGHPLVTVGARLRGVRILVQTISVALLALVWSAALLGSDDGLENIAPTWIYVVFWLGVPLLSVLLGDVWRVVSPWRALADAFVWLWERTGRRAVPLATYPQRLGRWPAAVSLFAFTALELAYSEPAAPRPLALAIALYTYVTLAGMAAFGRETWSRNGEGFAVAFALFARLAPLAWAAGRLRLRWPGVGLVGAERTPGSVAVVAVLLGSVLFDGYSRTITWSDFVADLEGPYILDRPRLAELVATSARLAGLVVAVALVALVYVVTCAAARALVRAQRSLVTEFLSSLVPIAFVYLVAHYFSLVVIQGQFLVPLASDPYGSGRDLFGSAEWVPNLTPLAPETVWYVQVGALVVGHVAGLVLAHDRALAIFVRRRDALQVQFPLLALMVLYTVAGLWVLSRG